MTDDALKLTAYVGERKRSGGRFVADALMDVYGRHRVEVSVLLRGTEGFGLAHHLRTDSSLTLSEDLPAVAVAVDSRERIEAVLDAAVAAAGTGLFTLERARLQTGSSVDATPAAPPPHASKLTVYVGRYERVGRRSAFVAVCDVLRRSGVDGASALLGVDGTRRGVRHRARLFGRNADVPVMITAIGAGQRIAAVFGELGDLLREPTTTIERVRVCKQEGTLVQTPQELPGVDEHGVALYQQLTIYTSESDLFDGRPLHRVLTRRLRETGAAGVTTLRGMWGFHGAVEPHGDRLLQLGRHVPTVSIVIDSPQRIAASFDVVDELTAEHGLVTSELVPALRASAPGEIRGGLRLSRYDS